MEEKEKELNCWNHSVLEKPKWEIATNKRHPNILCQKTNYSPRKEIDGFVIYLEVIRFGGKVFGTVTQMIALNKPFIFIVPHLRLYYPICDTNL